RSLHGPRRPPRGGRRPAHTPDGLRRRLRPAERAAGPAAAPPRGARLRHALRGHPRRARPPLRCPGPRAIPPRGGDGPSRARRRRPSATTCAKRRSLTNEIPNMRRGSSARSSGWRSRRSTSRPFHEQGVAAHRKVSMKSRQGADMKRVRIPTWMLWALALALMAVPSLAADYPTPTEGSWVVRDFRFHAGETLPELRLHYTTGGAPPGEPVLILHGTTGSGARFLTPNFAGELFG